MNGSLKYGLAFTCALTVWSYAGYSQLDDVKQDVSSVKEQLNKPDEKASPDYGELLKTVVKIEGKRGHGSGVLIAPDLILTNHHVAKIQDEMTVRFEDGAESKATTIAVGHGADWAIMRLSESVERKAAKMDCRLPEYGEKVVSYGSPMVLEFVMSEGNVSSSFVMDGAPRGIYVFDAQIGPGSSGGPVFDSDGELIGINTVSFIGRVGFGSPTMMGLNGFTSITEFCGLYK